MLLAEALAARNDAKKVILAAGERLGAAAVRFEDEDEQAKEAELAAAESALDEALARFEALSVAINRANNVARVAFADETLSLMEAIARRDRLMLEAKQREAALDAADEAMGRAGRRRYGSSERRTKDDVRRLAVGDATSRRAAHDTLARRIRELDLAIQQVNWTTEVGGV
jgi:hypothetical protein